MRGPAGLTGVVLGSEQQVGEESKVLSEKGNKCGLNHVF